MTSDNSTAGVLRRRLRLPALADDLRRFETEFTAAWHARNRPSEYWRVREALREVAARLDGLELKLAGRGTV